MQPSGRAQPRAARSPVARARRSGQEVALHEIVPSHLRRRRAELPLAPSPPSSQARRPNARGELIRLRECCRGLALQEEPDGGGGERSRVVKALTEPAPERL